MQSTFFCLKMSLCLILQTEGRTVFFPGGGCGTKYPIKVDKVKLNAGQEIEASNSGPCTLLEIKDIPEPPPPATEPVEPPCDPTVGTSRKIYIPSYFNIIIIIMSNPGAHLPNLRYGVQAQHWI